MNSNGKLKKEIGLFTLLSIGVGGIMLTGIILAQEEIALLLTG